MMIIGDAFESQLEQKAIILILHSKLLISYNRKTTVIQLKMRNCEVKLRIKTCRTESIRFNKFSLPIRL